MGLVLSQHHAQVREDASHSWQAARDTWNSHVQHLHETVADKQAGRDLRGAQRDADTAEEDAVAVVEFALAAMDEAEDAVLDAILARADADVLAADA